MKRTVAEWKQEFERFKGLKDVPLEERTKDVCIAALEAGGGDWDFRFVPEGLLGDQDVWNVAFMYDACGFAAVPDAFKTPEMCARALETWPLALRWVPDALKTEDMCGAAFARDPRAAVFVPAELKTEAMEAAVARLQVEAARAGELAEAPEGGRVKVRSVAFLPPGTRFPRWGEVPEDVQNQAVGLSDEDIVVTEWGEPGGCPEWQYQTFRHAVLPEDEDGDGDFDPERLDWDEGVDYAWNCVCSRDYTEKFAKVFWRSISLPEGDDEAGAMDCETGIWAEVDGFGPFPLKAGDLWYAYGISATGQGVFDFYDKVFLLRDAIRWANPALGWGKSEVLAHLALDVLYDDETDLEAWFADELGGDAWVNSGRFSSWIAEDRTGGVAMPIFFDRAEGTEREQLFAGELEWGAIVCALHYGDFDPETGREMNPYEYDGWAEWAVAGAEKNRF